MANKNRAKDIDVIEVMSLDCLYIFIGILLSEEYVLTRMYSDSNRSIEERKRIEPHLDRLLQNDFIYEAGGLHYPTKKGIAYLEYIRKCKLEVRYDFILIASE